MRAKTRRLHHCSAAIASSLSAARIASRTPAGTGAPPSNWPRRMAPSPSSASSAPSTWGVARPSSAARAGAVTGPRWSSWPATMRTSACSGSAGAGANAGTSSAGDSA
jgi:hypothetical protein